MRYHSIIFFLIFALTGFAQSSSFYATKYNNFEQLNYNSIAQINGDYLQLNNTSNSFAFIEDTTRIDPFSNYKYYIKFANLHNKEGKSYKVKDTNNKTISVSQTKCGIVFNKTSNSYWMVTASCRNTSLYNETADNRFMDIELLWVNDGSSKLIDKVSIDKDINLDERYNYLGINIEDSCIKVLAGKDKLNEVLTHKMTHDEIIATHGYDCFNVAIAVGPGAFMSTERAVLTTPVKSHTINLETQWTIETLNKHFAQSKNPYEGFWTYLDRDMEDTWLKLGGRYTIALVENENGYDVIYVDGAQVKKSMWRTGMKKGQMTKTIFTDNFNGMWIDATLMPIDQDVYATFESGVILNFKFPVYKSQIRFSKVLQE